jgi:hypothetical protein
LSRADGDWDLNYEQYLECQGYECKIFKHSCQVQIFINDVTTISLDSSADPQSNWIEISINSLSMTQRRSFNWIDLN